MSDKDTATTETTTTEQQTETKATFTPPTSQEELDRMVADRIRRAEAKAKSDAKTEFDAEQKRLKDEADAEADRQKQIAAGQFDTVKQSLEAERDQFKGNYEAANDKLTKLIDAIRPEVEQAWKALPEEVAELYQKVGDGDDTLERKEFMANHKKLIDKLTAQQDEKNEAFKRFPRTPQPNHDGSNVGDEQAKQRYASQYTG